MHFLKSLLFTFAVIAPTLAAAAHWPDLSTPAAGVGDERTNDAAVIVGIDQYTYIPHVTGASLNARAWFDYLNKTRGVPTANITLLCDNEATLENMTEYASQAASLAVKNGTLWFIFIGHGAPDAVVKDGLLVGVDTQASAKSIKARSLPRNKLLAALAQSKADRIVVVIDACFSGRDTSGLELVEGLQPLVLINKPHMDSRFTVLTAGRADEYSGPLPGVRRPAFSYIALGALRGWAKTDRNGNITAGNVLRYSEETIRATVHDRNQHPTLTGNPDTILGQSSGENGPDIAEIVKNGVQPTEKPAPEPHQPITIRTQPTDLEHAVLTIAPHQSEPLHQSKRTQLAQERLFVRTVRLKNGKVLITGGSDGRIALNSCELYDPASRQWSRTGDMIQIRASNAIALLNDGRILVAGGAVFKDDNTDTAETYDPITEQWSKAASMHEPRSGPGFTILKNGKVLVAGGRIHARTLTKSAEIYNPDKNTWELTASMNTDHFSMQNLLVTLKNGKVLVAGGMTNKCELYDPATGKWTMTGSMAYERTEHTLTLLKNGRVLAAGGNKCCNSAYALSSAEIYDPATGEWTMVSSLNDRRTLHSATLMKDGRVFVAAGTTGRTSDVFESAEIYDPEKDTWEIAGRIAGRAWHTAELLPNGEVMIMAGQAHDLPLSSVSIYTPPTEKNRNGNITEFSK